MTEQNRPINFAMVVFVVGALAAAGWFYNSVVNPPHGRLQLDMSSARAVNKIFRQYNKPTASEQEAGRNALRAWKGASRSGRSRLADDLILSNVLLGMTQKEIVSYLGPPDAFAALPDIGPHIEHTGYNVADGESQCDLMIDLKDNGKATDVYLDVNY